MGRTKEYSNVSMYFTLILIALEFICVKLLDSPVFIAIASESCSIAKCIVFFVLIAKLSSKKVTDILPTKQLMLVLIASIVASIPVYFISKSFEWNKFVLLFFDVFVFCVFYYVFCWIGKITYRDIVASVVKNNKIIKLIP